MGVNRPVKPAPASSYDETFHPKRSPALAGLLRISCMAHAESLHVILSELDVFQANPRRSQLRHGKIQGFSHSFERFCQGVDLGGVVQINNSRYGLRRRFQLLGEL